MLEVWAQLFSESSSICLLPWPIISAQSEILSLNNNFGVMNWNCWIETYFKQSLDWKSCLKVSWICCSCGETFMIQISAHLIHSVMRYLRIMPVPIKRERSVLILKRCQFYSTSNQWYHWPIWCQNHTIWHRILMDEINSQCIGRTLQICLSFRQPHQH